MISLWIVSEVFTLRQNMTNVLVPLMKMNGFKVALGVCYDNFIKTNKVLFLMKNETKHSCFVGNVHKLVLFMTVLYMYTFHMYTCKNITSEIGVANEFTRKPAIYAKHVSPVTTSCLSVYLHKCMNIKIQHKI